MHVRRSFSSSLFRTFNAASSCSNGDRSASGCWLFFLVEPPPPGRGVDREIFDATDDEAENVRVVVKGGCILLKNVFSLKEQNILTAEIAR